MVKVSEKFQETINQKYNIEYVNDGSQRIKIATNQCFETALAAGKTKFYVILDPLGQHGFVSNRVSIDVATPMTVEP